LDCVLNNVSDANVFAILRMRVLHNRSTDNRPSGFKYEIAATCTYSRGECVRRRAVKWLAWFVSGSPFVPVHFARLQGVESIRAEVSGQSRRAWLDYVVAYREVGSIEGQRAATLLALFMFGVVAVAACVWFIRVGYAADSRRVRWVSALLVGSRVAGLPFGLLCEARTTALISRVLRNTVLFARFMSWRPK